VRLPLESFKQIGEALKVWAEFIAYGSGGVFLIYKIVSGYFITDLSLRITCERFPLDNESDNLSVAAMVRKGDKGTVRIHDCKIRVTDMAGQVLDEKRMCGTDRLSFNMDKTGRMSITFARTSKKHGLSLPPGDETQFAGLCNVPTETPCMVEVVILGKKLWGGKAAQWRASAVSFPNIVK